MQFQGIYTPLITPFHDDFSIDRDGLAALIESLIAAGVHGLVLAGTTGEYYAQTVEERIGLMSFVRERIGQRVPLIVGVGALRTEEAVDLARHARKAGADALLVGSPYYAMPTEIENAAHALAIERAAELPIMLYNFPARTGAMMGEAFLKQVGKNPHFCAIKESSGDITQLHRLACDYPRIQLCCGMDDQALEFFAWGAKSWVCGASNFLPREHIALFEACALRGDFEKGRRIMSALMPLMRTLEQGCKYVQSVKHGCGLVQLPAGPVRKPLQQLLEQEKQALESVIVELKKDMAQITNNEALNNTRK
jgi:4-hydroxy-tetrahydrodipicolinate synthase